MLTFLIIIAIFISILLTFVVLLQPGKGDMISGMAGLGGQFNSVLGSRRAADFLTKLTVGLAFALMALSLITNLFFVGNSNTVEEGKAATEGIKIERPLTPPSNMPPPQ
jgi:protein translocase SecG subunit